MEGQDQKVQEEQQTGEAQQELPSYGVKETKELLKFVIGLGMALEKALADGAIGVGDLVSFWSPLMNINDALKDISLVPKELADLSEDEKAELLAYIEQEFDIGNDALEAVIEKALKAGLQAFELIQCVKKLKSSKGEG